MDRRGRQMYRQSSNDFPDQGGLRCLGRFQIRNHSCRQTYFGKCVSLSFLVCSMYFFSGGIPLAKPFSAHLIVGWSGNIGGVVVVSPSGLNFPWNEQRQSGIPSKQWAAGFLGEGFCWSSNVEGFRSARSNGKGKSGHQGWRVAEMRNKGAA